MGKKSRKGRKKALPGGIIPPGTAPGSRLTVPLPDGRNVTLTTPPGVKPGDRINLEAVSSVYSDPNIALALEAKSKEELRDLLAKNRERVRGAARDRADALQKLTNAKEARLSTASSQADVAASRSAVARPSAGIPPPGRAPTPPASSPKPLTDDELRALAKTIQGLPPDKLVHVEPILKGLELVGHVGDGEFAVHLDALDPGTLRRLQTFVNVLTATQPLTLSSLASLPAEHQKSLIVERLYPLVHEIHPELAGKITVMLLELPIAELLHLLETPDALRLKVLVVVTHYHRQEARKISVATAVAEAAARDIPPSDPNNNKRFISATEALLAAIIRNEEDMRNLHEYRASFNGRVSAEEHVKNLKRWPRLRKYWPRLRRRFCSYCGKGTLDLSAPRLMVCGGCGQGRGVGRYCSEDCQRAAWPEHQRHCPAFAPEPPTPPEPWQAFWDTDSGSYYFGHPGTGDVQWDMPGAPPPPPPRRVHDF